MRRTPARLVLKLLGLGAVSAGLVAVAGFTWFVLISWSVLEHSLGLAPLALLLLLAAGAAATWGAELLRRTRRPARPATPARRTAVVAVTVLAAITGLIAVPTTRARLEADKCRRRAAPDTGSQTQCHHWLESRREWWTLGLSHKNPAEH
ncbi:MAG: hypothetical protein LC792_15125 [Actinobacteria bacterium]|nr:hypothetical protein [Actinomycetota bacterium]